MAKRVLSKVFIAIWVLLIGVLGVYYLFFAPRDSEFTEEENRTLAAFPVFTTENVFSGKFGEEMETYLLDRFPVRNAAIAAVNCFQSLISLASHEEYLLIADDVDDPLDAEVDQDDLDDLLAGLATQPTQSPTQPTQPTQTQPEDTLPAVTEPIETEPVEDPPIETKAPASAEDFPETLGMYMDTGSGETALRSYERNNVLAVTAVLNKYAALLPENGKLMFTIGPPSYLVHRFVNASTKNSFYNTWDEMINAMGIDNVYAFDSSEILSEAIKEDKYVSFRTDNHWTPYGAYLVYQQMAARAGKELCAYPDDFDITMEANFRGTYYRDNPSAYMNVQPDILERLMPTIDVEYRKITGPDTYEVIPFLDFNAKQNDRYTVYLGGPGGPWRYVQCDNDETENCLVITDSFGLTVMPFLTHNYNQVHYYDARYYNRNTVGYTVAEMMEKYNIHDIYVIVADFHSFSSNFLIGNVNKHLNG